MGAVAPSSALGAFVSSVVTGAGWACAGGDIWAAAGCAQSASGWLAAQKHAATLPHLLNLRKTDKKNCLSAIVIVIVLGFPTSI